MPPMLWSKIHRRCALQVLSVLKVDAEALADSTDSTAALADKVSRTVRELDTAQSRVQATLDRIQLVMDRMQAIEGIQSALAREDYEAAAECVARCLELEEEAGTGSAAATPTAAAAAAVPTGSEGDARHAAEQARVLAEGRAALERIVRTRGAAAAAAQDHAGVVRFARLHAPLRLRQQGLELLTSFLRSLIASRAKEDYAALVRACGCRRRIPGCSRSWPLPLPPSFNPLNPVMDLAVMDDGNGCSKQDAS